METKQEYVQRYYDLYSSGNIDAEMITTGSFLVRNAKGRVLDCGSGPVPQLWAIFMPEATEVHAVDLPEESVSFVKQKLEAVDEWQNDFSEYQRVVEQITGQQPSDYVRTQVQKLKTIRQADMAESLPFPDQYFDTAVSLYSLGCLKNVEELERAIENINRVLKPGGTLLHINTDGQNRNAVLPAYTWNGMDQSSDEIVRFLRERAYTDIQTSQEKLPQEASAMYKYGAVSLLLARKPL